MGGDKIGEIGFQEYLLLFTIVAIILFLIALISILKNRFKHFLQSLENFHNISKLDRKVINSPYFRLYNKFHYNCNFIFHSFILHSFIFLTPYFRTRQYNL